MLQGVVRIVICEFVEGGPPNVTVKYGIVDTENPGLGEFPAERAITDPAIRAGVAAQAAGLVPATSTALGIPLALPDPTPPAPPTLPPPPPEA